jgi:D-sedoheptulose 7-phosphate isomerase
VTAAAVRAGLEALARTALDSAALADQVASAALRYAGALRAGGTLFFCGNGGSAADAQHIAAEFVGRFQLERDPLPAVALSVNTSALTAIANDYGADEMFARGVRAHGRPGDILVALSTSGTSPNVLAAVKAAHETGLTTWAMAGPAPNPLAAMCDDAICVEASTTATVQEVHLLLVHALCIALDDRLLGAGHA